MFIFKSLNESIGLSCYKTPVCCQHRKVLGHERNVFAITDPNMWDAHSDLGGGTADQLLELDDALGPFIKEMKAQGMWDALKSFTR